ncbi:MAG: zinc ABC transporter substrate-binding protein [Rhodospirillales bacterium]|nr:zinc ABC transporter substrate-binding protein [Rhodospirillales bacterium]
MRKRITGGVLGLALVIAMPQAVQAKLNIFACFPEWRALSTELGGDAVDVYLAVSALNNPEQVEVNSTLIAALKTADLLVCTGGGFEDAWLPKALEKARNPKLARGQPGLFYGLDFVKPLPDDHGNAGPKKDGDLHDGGNPHVQGDPHRIRAIAGRLGQRLIQLDPANADRYKSTVRSFISGFGTLIKTLEKQAEPLRGINIVAQHEHSAYLLAWLRIQSAAIVEPNVGVPPGPVDLARIVSLVPRANVKLIAHAAYEDPRPSAFIAKKTGIPLINLPFTVGGTEDSGTIFEFYTTSVQRLLDGLSGRSRP